MRYLVLSNPSEEYAAALSAALYALSAHATTTGTAYAVPWVADPETGNVALDLTGDQYMQPSADISAFVDLLPIPASEATALVEDMSALRGQRVAYVDMVPPSLQPALIDKFGPQA